MTSLRNNETQGVTSRRECQVGRKEALATHRGGGGKWSKMNITDAPARSDAPAFVVRAIGSFSKAGSFGMWVQLADGRMCRQRARLAPVPAVVRVAGLHQKLRELHRSTRR